MFKVLLIAAFINAVIVGSAPLPNDADIDLGDAAANRTSTPVIQESSVAADTMSLNVLDSSYAIEIDNYSSTDRLPNPVSRYVKPAHSLMNSFGFDPGYIISDIVFFNNDSMTVEGIESFFDYAVPECLSEKVPCLKDFRLDIPATPADEEGICNDIPARKNVSAAYAIKTVADACGINPQVILTHIEKEQGLVSSTSPSQYMYNAAMGFNCSEGSVCGKISGGFWKQIYEGSKQKIWYGEPSSPFKHYKIGEESKIKYHPNASCGTKPVIIQNRATASLYYYTPYVPNNAAIKNLSGLGDECSSYGNRNFFRIFNEWFGDSRAVYKLLGPAR